MANSNVIVAYDKSIPVETKIYFSKTGAIGGVLVGFVAIVVGFWFFTTSDYIWGSIICLAGLFLAYSNFKTFKNNQPQIIINHGGILTAFSPFHSWYQITNERVITETQGRYSNIYLIYNTNNGSEKMSISNLNTNKDALQNLLFIYRERSKIKTNH
jgi:hypothetical protein